MDDSTRESAPLATYTEKLLQVRRTFRLYRDRVTIHARWLLKGDFQSTVRLAELEPRPTTMTIRNRWTKRAIMIGSLAVAAAVVFGRANYEPWGPKLAPFGWGIAAGCAVIAIRTFRKIPFVRFRATSGKGGLDIGRAGPDAGRFDEFVREVQRQIRKGESRMEDREWRIDHR